MACDQGDFEYPHGQIAPEYLHPSSFYQVPAVRPSVTLRLAHLRWSRSGDVLVDPRVGRDWCLDGCCLARSYTFWSGWFIL